MKLIKKYSPYIALVYSVLLIIVGLISLIKGNLIVSVATVSINLILSSIIIILDFFNLKSKDELVVNTLTRLSLVALERNKLRNILNKNNIKED